MIATAVRQSAACKDSAAVAKLLLLANIDLYREYNHERSISTASGALAAAERLGLWSSAADALLVIGANYQFIDRYDSALASFRQLALLAHRHNLPVRYVTALTQQGGIYRNRGEYDAALSCLLDAMRTVEKLNDTSLKANVVESLGRLYGIQGQFSEARSYLHQSLHLFTSLNDKRSQAFTHYFLGNVDRDDHKDSAAEASYNEALRLFLTMNGELHGKGLVLAELGSIYTTNKRYAEAEQTLSQALHYIRAAGDKRSTAHILNNLAQTLSALQQFAQAMVLANESYTVATAIGALKERLDAAYTLATVSERLGKTDVSLGWYKIALRVQDSLTSSTSRERMKTLERKYTNELKEREVAAIQRQNAAERLAAQNQRNLLLLGVASLIVVVVVALSRYRLKQRSENLLRRTNAQILEQQRELETQASIIQEANTALQNVNLQLETQNEELIVLNNNKNEFLGIAAHDLRSPLANIVALASMLHPSRAAEDLAWASGAIETSAAKMLNLIERLLEMNSLERGGVALHLVDVDIAECFRQSANNHTPQAEAKKIILLTNAAPSCHALADKQAVEQIADNLLSNAIKYSPTEKRIWITVESCGSIIRASVRDEGQGLSETDKRKVFTSFAKLSARPTGGETSTGLGLSIVKTLVEMMRGSVRVESEYGSGATFIVEFPVVS